MRFRPQIDLVEECRRELRVAAVALHNAGAKLGAIVNTFAPKDHDLYEDAVRELDEAAIEFTYRNQLLSLAIREEAERATDRKLVVLDGGKAA